MSVDDGQDTKWHRNVVSYSSLVAQVWHVSTRGHTDLLATHTFIHKSNEPYLPLSPAAERRRTSAGTHFPPAEGRRTSWSRWLGEILRWFVRPKTVTHGSICRSGLELNPRPSSRESYAITTRPLSHQVHQATLSYATTCQENT